MGYPCGKTYLERIQEDAIEMARIRNVFWTLRKKYIIDHRPRCGELSLKQEFAILGEAFEIGSMTLDGTSDQYHFMWDILDVLLPDSTTNDN